MSRPVSVVIPMFNAESTIGAQLDALASQNYAGPLEVVVADNGSSDSGAAVVLQQSDRFSALRLVDAGHVRGEAATRNTGLRAAAGEFLLTCDADDVVSEQWVQAMDLAASDNAVLGGPLDPTEINAPSIIAWRQSSGRSEPPSSFGRPHFLTSNMGFSRSTFQELGGFREAFDHGGADVDYCLRAHDRGMELRFVPDAVVHYRYRVDVRSFAKQSFGYGRSSSRLRRAHGTSGEVDGGPLVSAAGAARRLASSATGAVTSKADRVRLAAQASYLAGRLLGRLERWDADGPEH